MTWDVLYAVLGAIGGFIASQVWPYIIKRDTREWEAEQKRSRQEIADRTEREQRAFEALARLNTTLESVSHTMVKMCERMSDMENNTRQVSTTLMAIQSSLSLMSQRLESIEREQDDMRKSLQVIETKMPRHARTRKEDKEDED